MSCLDSELIAAHEAEDNALLVRLYTQAASDAGNTDAAGFYMTHAYIFALEAGLPQAPELRQRLIDMGRETPL